MSNKYLQGIQVQDEDGDVILKLWVDAYQWSCSPTKKNECDGTSHQKEEEHARQVLKEAGDPTRLTTSSSENGLLLPPTIVPIPILLAMKVVFLAQQGGEINKLRSLESCLANGKISLAYTTTSTATTTAGPSSTSSSSSDDGKSPEEQKHEKQQQQQRWQKRMDRLRLQNEERRYSKLTGNLQDHRKHDDDVTVKSMTYAASVGLNMIIAPLSFGCFMYFFAGGIFDFFFATGGTDNKDEKEDITASQGRHNNSVDIKRVIVGVISGVAMMFIEMILFVIRTHEFEEHTRKKKKTRGVQPFGVYTKNSPAVYTSSSAKAGALTTKPTIAENRVEKDLVTTSSGTRPPSSGGRKKTNKVS